MSFGRCSPWCECCCWLLSRRRIEQKNAPRLCADEVSDNRLGRLDFPNTDEGQYSSEYHSLERNDMIFYFVWIVSYVAHNLFSGIDPPGRSQALPASDELVDRQMCRSRQVTTLANSLKRFN